MAAGRLQYTIFSAYFALLLLGFSLHDVETSGCERNIHKKVGDTVELSSCLPAEGVTLARWKYGLSVIAGKTDVVFKKHQFEGRVDFNQTDFSLTVRRLTLRDSGEFYFLSETNSKQRETVTVTLQVHETITEQPLLVVNSIWHKLTNSCLVLLECIAITGSDVTYDWTVRTKTSRGSRLQYLITPQDGDTEFTCTIYNFVSEKSTMKTVKCSNDTSGTQEPACGSSSLVPLIMGLVIGILLIILLLLSVLFYTKSEGPCCYNRVTQTRTVDQEETQQHVYSSLLHGDGSAYETMRGSARAGTVAASDLAPGPSREVFH